MAYWYYQFLLSHQIDTKKWREKEKETFASEIMCQRILCKILRLANQQRKVDEKMRSTHWSH